MEQYSKNSREQKIRKRKYTLKHENSTFISFIFSFDWHLMLANFETNFKSGWLFWRDFSTSTRICTFSWFAIDLLTIYIVYSTDLSQVISQCWGKKYLPVIRKGPLNCLRHPMLHEHENHQNNVVPT